MQNIPTQFFNTSRHYLENKRQQFWFCRHMLSGNGQARPHLEYWMPALPFINGRIHSIYTRMRIMVMVSRNLERANENDGFKMTALEFYINN